MLVLVVMLEPLLLVLPELLVLDALLLVEVGEADGAQDPQKIEHAEQYGQHEPPIGYVVRDHHVLLEHHILERGQLGALALVEVAEEAAEHECVVGNVHQVAVAAGLRRLKQLL